jgi:tol-pal system protein YbgF
VAVTGVASAKEEHAYQKAFELLNQRRYDEARTAFLKFLQSYPTSVYSDNAQYWLGEASYVTRDFDRALVEFEKVLSNYPSSPKVAGAMLKIGFIQFDQRQLGQARATLDTLVSRYPDSSAARLAQEFIRKKNL